MLAFTTSILLGTILGTRLTLAGFLPVFILATAAAGLLAGPLAALLTLLGAQAGYIFGVLLHAYVPALPARRPLPPLPVRR